MFRLKLIDRGIDKADIVLGFYHPEHRKLTDERDRTTENNQSAIASGTLRERPLGERVPLGRVGADKVPLENHVWVSVPW